MARPVSANHELRREAILEVAAQCFADFSYPAASMSQIAQTMGTSKARLYHYYESKEALLFDLLDRYTQRLLSLIELCSGKPVTNAKLARACLHELIRLFLIEYESSATRHKALLNDIQFLNDSQRSLIIDRQRLIVTSFTRLMQKAYPRRMRPDNQAALTMMLFGMINWTFTWLKPNGALSYSDFAEEVIVVLESGLLQKSFQA
jgi:AcrR family transcriptional regulator